MSASLDRAWQLFQLNRYDLAEKELRGVLAGEPNDATAHAMLGYVLARRGKYYEAQEETAEAKRLGPDLAYPHFVSSWTMGAQKDFAMARRDILEALRLWPDNPDYLDQLSWVELSLDRPVRALEAADQGLASDARHAGCLNCKALALSRLGNHQRAIELLRQALAIEPLSSRFHTNLGWVHHQAGQTEAALEHFSEGLRLEPDSVEAKNAFTTGVKEAVKSWRLRTAIWAIAGCFVLSAALCGLELHQGLGLTPLMAGFLGMLISSTFVLQLRQAGRSLLSDKMWAECRWLNAGLIASILLGYAVLWFSHLESKELVAPLASLGSATTVALFFGYRPGWPRARFVAVAALSLFLAISTQYSDKYTRRLGAFYFIFWYVIITFIGVKVILKADPYADIRGLVIREGWRRQATTPLPDPEAAARG